MKNRKDLSNELNFSASRSSGPGGQAVNKSNTKVMLRFDVSNSSQLTEEEKTMVMTKLSSHISNDGILYLSSEEERSQLANKTLVTEKFYALLQHAFFKPKRRIKTKPGKGAIQKRLDAKKLHSAKKENRKWKL